MGANVYTFTVLCIFVSAAATFVALSFFSAPYGRHSRRGWGLSLQPRWAWLIMESPSAIAMAAMAAAGRARDLLPLLFLGCWELHYIYRSFVYPFLIRGAEKRNFPFLLMAIALLYNSANAYVNGYNLFWSGRVYTAAWFADIRFIAGSALFVAGLVTHLDSDARLRRLRSAGESGYRVPYGGLFRYVSSPNYLGEIVEWCGFALATWSIAGLSFAAFTAANLVPRALSNHAWYRRHFAEYPKERRALVPFLL